MSCSLIAVGSLILRFAVFSKIILSFFYYGKTMVTQKAIGIFWLSKNLLTNLLWKVFCVMMGSSLTNMITTVFRLGVDGPWIAKIL